MLSFSLASIQNKILNFLFKHLESVPFFLWFELESKKNICIFEQKDYSLYFVV